MGASGGTDDRAWRYAEVACLRCGTVVQVAKFSAQHTSVQWAADGVLGCAEFGPRVSAGELSALIATCASLRASIDEAVAGGQILVQPP